MNPGAVSDKMGKVTSSTWHRDKVKGHPLAGYAGLLGVFGAALAGVRPAACA
jgi:hypothetical protein